MKKRDYIDNRTILFYIITTIMVVALLIISATKIGKAKSPTVEKDNDIVMHTYNSVIVEKDEELTRNPDDIVMLPEVPADIQAKREYDNYINEMNKPVQIGIPSENIVEPSGKYTFQDYPGYYTMFMDLSVRRSISEANIQKCIDYWTYYNPTSVLKNKDCAAAIIEAARESEYDPVFLLALIGVESGWGTSQLHIDTNNPYSIGMIDGYEEDNAFIFDDAFDNGIIEGAKYIRTEWYDNGYTTLYEMEYGLPDGRIRVYSTSYDSWINNICEIMTTCYELIEIDVKS